MGLPHPLDSPCSILCSHSSLYTPPPVPPAPGARNLPAPGPTTCWQQSLTLPIPKFGKEINWLSPTVCLPHNSRLGLCVHLWPSEQLSEVQDQMPYKLLLPGAVTRAGTSKSAVKNQNGKEYEKECIYMYRGITWLFSRNLKHCKSTLLQ